MSHLRFASMRLQVRFAVLAGPAVLAFGAAPAYGQGHSMQSRPVMMSPMTRSTMSMPVMTNPSTRMNTTTNALLRQDLRLDSLLLRDLRFDRLRREFGFGPFSGMSFGTSPWWGMWGGGVGGWGAGVIPVGIPSGAATPVAQKSPGDAEEAARAALLLEKVIAERLENRRRAFDEMAYERANTPTPSQELLSRSRGNPPRAEVISGQALNALLDDLRATVAADRPNAVLPLDQQELRHINVTRGAGSFALLKNGGRVNWPASLSGPTYRTSRDGLMARTQEAVGRLQSDGRIDPDVVRLLAGELNQLRALVRQNVKELSFHSYSEARHFLDRLDDALVALKQPDAANYFNGTYDLRARTVFGLVREMTENGLRFAPAAAGDEAAYGALREALAVCDRAVTKPSSRAP